MTLDLPAFRSALGALSNTSIAYIDEEGSEIPISSECEFQEALRLGRLSKTGLKLIFYCAEPELNEIMYFDQYEFGSNPAGKFAGLVRKSRRCHGDVAPVWFTDYMKKFKKELLHEMKSYINETVHTTVAKEKRKSEKLIIGEILGFPERKKKKASERDFTDLMDQREMRLPRNSYASKNEPCFDPSEIMVDMVHEERRVPESKHHSRSKSDRICSLLCDWKPSSKKSASFDQNSMCLLLPLGSDFTVTVRVTNDGEVQWSVPYLECFEQEGLSLHEFRISLPRLLPTESRLASFRGKLSDKAGVHYLKCKVVDGLERIGPVFTCWIRVFGAVESPQKSLSDSAGVRETGAGDSESRVGTLIDLERDLIISSQKKIEENINEIERRLRDIDLLQPSTCREQKSGNEAELEEELIIQSFYPFEWDDPFDLDAAGEVSTFQIAKEEGNKETKVIMEDLLSPSSSELSIVLISKEEDNFLEVQSEALSSAESGSEDKKPPIADWSQQKVAEPKENEAEFNEQPAKPEIQNESLQGQADRDEAPANVEDLHPSQASPTSGECLFSAEDFSRPKKMKSKSSEYRFKAANLTQPTFRKLEGRPSRFTFTGEKEVKGKKANKQRFRGTSPPFAQSPGFSEGKQSAFTFTGEEQKSNDHGAVPKTDALGRIIYAVTSSGYCIPVESLPKYEETSRSPNHSNQRTQPRQTYPPNDTSNGSTLPNALVNAVSSALNVAKCVINRINNLQLESVTEGKTETGQPIDGDIQTQLEYLVDYLCEMGYLNVDLNRELLLLSNNDIGKVVDTLVRLQKDSP